MNDDDESVLPETAPKIEKARRVPGVAWTPLFKNIGAALSERVLLAPDKNFLTYCDDAGNSTRWTYSEVYTTTLQLAELMHSELQIGIGERIATLSFNDPRIIFIYFAAWLIGAVVVPINCSEDDDRINYILNNASAKALLVASDQVGRISRSDSAIGHTANESVGGIMRPEHVVEVDVLGGVFDSRVAVKPLLQALPDIGEDSECLIVYTSGTTGAPKGVLLEQRNLIADAQSIAEWHRFGPDDRAMCVLPIHHVNGTVVTLVTPLVTGGSVVLNRRLHSAGIWQTLARERCTWVSVVPTVLAFLSERKEDLANLDLTAFRHIICGAGPLTVEVAHRFNEAFGVRVVHGYGLSETTCYSCFLPIDLEPEEYAHWMFECGFPSIGCAISANEMTIHDVDGNSLQQDVRDSEIGGSRQ